MDFSPMRLKTALLGVPSRIVSICVVAIILGIAGCRGFFVPQCQEYNNCTSTTTSTTATTGTTSTTATTGTTGTTSTTATTGTTATTATTSTTSTTSTTGMTTSTTSTTGTSPITPSASRSSYVYVSNANTGTIGTFAVKSGGVSSVAQSTINAPASPTAISGTPREKLLYLATRNGAVYLNWIGSDGNLRTGNNGNSVANVIQPTWMSMDRTGGWLFVASSIANDVQEFRIDAVTGALHPMPQPLAIDPGSPAEVYVTPNNLTLFVALGKGGVDAFSFDATTGAVGTRQHIVPLHSGSEDRVLTADDASRNVYISESNTGIRAFAIGSSATLQEISGSPFGSPASVPTSMVMQASGAHLVAANSGANTITQYSITPNGALVVLSRSSASTDSSPAALMVGTNGNVVSISRDAVPNSTHLPQQ